MIDAYTQVEQFDAVYGIL